MHAYTTGDELELIKAFLWVGPISEDPQWKQEQANIRLSSF